MSGNNLLPRHEFVCYCGECDPDLGRIGSTCLEANLQAKGIDLEAYIEQASAITPCRATCQACGWESESVLGIDTANELYEAHATGCPGVRNPRSWWRRWNR